MVCDVVLREIACQKSQVREKFGKLSDDVDDDELCILESTNDVFPTWLTKRNDFQKLFPQYGNSLMNQRETVLFAMQKDVTERTRSDMDHIVNFISQFPILGQLPKQLRRNLAKHLRLCCYEANSVICTNGAPANIFFMILDGKVRAGDGTLDKGGSFGVNALTGNLESVFNSNVATVSKTAMLELGAQDYRVIWKTYYQSRNNRLSKFLQNNVPLFTNWTKHRVNQISPLIQEKIYHAGDVIYSNDKYADYFYIVHIGVCVAEHQVVYDKSNKWPIKSINGCKSYEEKLNAVKKSVVLCELKPGDYFGEECVCDIPVYKTRATAKTMCQLFRIEKHYALSIFSSRTKEDMNSKHRLKSDEEIIADHERQLKLQREYKKFKDDSFGPAYSSRSRKKTVLRHHVSCPSLRYKKNNSTSKLPPLVLQ